MRWTLILVIGLGACTKWVPDDGYDAGLDSGLDSGVDATIDASVIDAAIDAAIDAGPECTGNGQCANPEPICDPEDHVCRGCNSGDSCGVGHPETPHCFDTRCVACLDSASHCTNAVAPICDATDHVCRGCDDDTDCAVLDPDVPACLEGSGACVVCDAFNTSACVNPSPVCDFGLNDCRPCRAHSECPSGACDYASGACLDETTEVIYVDYDLCGNGSENGSRTDPFCQVQAAVYDADATRRVILVAGSPTPYLRFTITDKDVWVIGATSGVVLRDTAGGEPVVKVVSTVATQHSRLTLESATVTNNVSDAPGLRCTGTSTANDSITLWDVLVTNNAGGGLSASNCSLDVDRSSFASNAGGGLSLVSTSFSITNSFITTNGGPSSNFGGLFISTAIAGSAIRFSTIMNNEVGTGITDPAGVFCSAGVCGSVLVNSAIVHANENADLSANLNFTYSLVGAGGISGLFNVIGIPSVDGAHHLQGDSPCINAGDPATTLLYDFDGDSRVLGGLPDIGADERQ